MPSSAPPAIENRPARSPFAGPGECGWRVRRAVGEAVLAGMLVLLVPQGVSQLGLEGGPQAIGIAVVLVRRRFPAACAVALAALTGLQPAVALLTAVAGYTAVRQAETVRRWAGLLLVAAAAAMATSTAFGALSGVSSGTFGLALGAVLALTAVIVPGLAGVARGQQDRLVRAWRERAAAAEKARRLADSESRMRERSRIAAEMHDLVGHRLSLVSLHAGGLEMALDKAAPELRDEAALVRSATRDAMQELREALGVLGPLGRDTGAEALTDATGTRADVEALVEESRSGGIPVELCWAGADLDARPARVRRAVHRVVRESLTNVHRYAAGAQVTVDVRHTGERVTVRVRNGVPPAPPAASTGLGSGQGLTGLRERVALLGGALEAHREPGGGFAVVADIPAEPGPAAEATDAAPDGQEGAALEEPGGGLSVMPRRLAGAVTGLLGLLGIGVVMGFGIVLVASALPDATHRDVEEPRLGMTRERVEDIVAADSDEVRAAAAGREPPRPGSATDCLYPRPDEEPRGRRLEMVRYCFRSGTLIAIDRFTVPLVTEKATEPPRRNTTHD
ncbi:sensor histidine kinase [Streptomyces angustmyceticus]|uniref:sensor histidine kinase n=1 Tax=Streptomyces angustmyceticus TaxID=285578 RepID=UPI00382F028D